MYTAIYVYDQWTCTECIQRVSGDKYGPATRHKLRGVNWTLMMGVRFVGNVANRSVLQGYVTRRMNSYKEQLTSLCSLSPPSQADDHLMFR